MPPYMAKPVSAMTTTETATMRFLNIQRGMIGSSARPSMRTKTAPMRAEKANMPMMGTETQGYSTPAQERASMAGTTVRTSAATPA